MVFGIVLDTVMAVIGIVAVWLLRKEILEEYLEEEK